jgi:hypothetical protein
MSETRVWRMFQARCTLCMWAGQIWGQADRGNAADEAAAHRRTPEHVAAMKAR